MASIFGIVAQYQSRLVMLPVTVLLFVVAALLLYVLFHRYTWVKYLPAVVGLIAGVLFLLMGFAQKATLEGLDQLWRGTYFFIGGCIALATAWLCALIESFSHRKPHAKQGKR